MDLKKEEIELRRRTIGKLLQHARIKRNVTQFQVAKTLRYTSAQFISNWERGIAFPPLDVLPPLMDLLGISQRELIDTVTRYQEESFRLQRRHIISLFKQARN